MNLHLIKDVPRYISGFIDRADRLGFDKEKYVCIKKNLKLNSLEGYERIEVVESYEDVIKMLEIKSFDRFYIHYLDKNGIKVLKNIKPKNKLNIYWFFWGNDGYKHPQIHRHIYMPETANILNEINPRKGIKYLMDKVRDYFLEKNINAAISKIDYCCIQVKGDYELIKKYTGNKQLQHIFFAYRGSKNNEMLKNNKFNSNSGLYKILLGNSANPSNNHIDALKDLALYENSIKEIICPLSYGGGTNYIEKVIDTGLSIFGKKFKPLTNYLSYEDYKKMIDSVEYGIFYHKRQQAYSNIIMLLQDGKKIYMNETSTLFKMFNELEVSNIYSDFNTLFSSEYESNIDLHLKLGESVIDRWYRNVLS